MSNPSKMCIRDSLRTELAYDGLSRWVGIVEKNNGTVTSQKNFVWDRFVLAEERDSSNNVTKRFFGQGEQRGSVNLYYTRDHLGSVREIVDATGAIRARYDYEPYGARRKLAGDLDCDFGFTGQYQHVPSGLVVFPLRAYSTDLGRWLSHDPSGESGGINLYSYGFNNPVNLTDPLGLCPGDWFTDLANWAQDTENRGKVWLGFDLPWEIQGDLDSAVGLLSLPEALSHLGEGTGTFTDNPTWGNSLGVGQDLLTLISVLSLTPEAAAETLTPDIAATFSGGKYTSTVLQDSMTAYRYSGGVSGATGRFLTTADTVSQISSPAAASIALKLPVGATAETLNTFTIPAGTRIFTGGVAGGADTATQIFIENPGILISH